MGFVDGWSPMNVDDWPAPFDTDVEARQGLAYQLVEGIALLSKVDWQAKGLQDLGRPDGFHERQVDRWTAFLERIKGRELPGLRRGGRLAARPPADRLRPGPHARRLPVRQRHVPPRRAGSAGRHRRLGDGHRRRPEARPRLGGAVAGPRTPTAPRPKNGYVDMTGMPSKDQVLARYAEVSGRQVDDIDYYVDPRQVEARRRARAGLPARAATTRSCTPSGRSCSTSCRAQATWPRSSDYRS